MFVMRTENYVPSWVSSLREVIGEEQVEQVRIRSKVAWAVPWNRLDDAAMLLKYYFSRVKPERESILDTKALSDDAKNELKRLMESSDFPALLPGDKNQLELWGGGNKLCSMLCKVDSVTVESESMAFVSLMVQSSRFNLPISPAEAKGFLDLVSKKVRITVGEV